MARKDCHHRGRNDMTVSPTISRTVTSKSWIYLLSDASGGVIKVLGQLDGDILVTVSAVKMGPTLARRAKRATAIAAGSAPEE